MLTAYPAYCEAPDTLRHVQEHLETLVRLHRDLAVGMATEDFKAAARHLWVADALVVDVHELAATAHPAGVAA